MTTTPGPWPTDPPPTLDLATVRGYVRVPTTSLSDEDLERMLDAASVDQWSRCEWDPTSYPAPLAQGLLRAIQKEIAARNLPLGMVGVDAAEYGPAMVPQYDALVEYHERAYRRTVLA
jgi:hypothetical protein